MNKRHLHHVWRQIRRVSYGYFLVAFILSSTVFVLAYRNNNLTAIRLRDQLIVDDKAGTHVEASLNNLRKYIYGHMNARLSGGSNSIYPPIQLKGTYDRLVVAEKQRSDAANVQASADGQKSCNGQPGYLLCVQNYEAAHNSTPQQIPDGLYKFDFVSPAWSPDLAGWSLVAAGIFFVLFVVRLVGGIYLKAFFKKHA